LERLFNPCESQPVVIAWHEKVWNWKDQRRFVVVREMVQTKKYGNGWLIQEVKQRAPGR
jgi:hypothetical protein